MHFLPSSSIIQERRAWPRRARFALAALWMHLRYLLWQELREAARIGLTAKDTTNTEFHLSLFTLLAGIWIMLWQPAFSPTLDFLKVFLPEWLWGAALFCAGRYGLHALVRGDECKRCRAMYVLFGCGLFLLLVSLQINAGALWTLTCGYYCFRVAVTSRQLCAGRKCAGHGRQPGEEPDKEQPGGAA